MPSPSPPRPASAAPRNRSKTKKLTIHVSVFNQMRWPMPKRDWAEDLPLDALLCILRKLGTVELLIGGAAGACRAWRRAAREEPVLWRHIDMLDLFAVLPSRLRPRIDFVVREALRLSAGQCEGFYGYDLHNELLLCLADLAPSLKSLHLVRSFNVRDRVFAKAIKKFPLLEELELSQCFYSAHLIELVATVCPRLKHFRRVRYVRIAECACCSPPDGFYDIDDRVAFAIARMRELRSLHLIGDNLSNKGLKAILDNCPHLEYFNLHRCQNVNMEEDKLVEKCAGVYMDDYAYFQPASPPTHDGDSSIDSCSDSGDDYIFDSYNAGDFDDLELEEAERFLDSKTMRRYLS